METIKVLIKIIFIYCTKIFYYIESFSKKNQ